MLLFVRQKYVEQIRAGVKRCEIRAGRRYRNVRAGDVLSLNGRERVIVTGVRELTAIRCEETGLIESAEDLRIMYPAELSFFVFDFDFVHQ